MYWKLARVPKTLEMREIDLTSDMGVALKSSILPVANHIPAGIQGDDDRRDFGLKKEPVLSHYRG